eukprot:752684-Hanusia_phi.AAC.1
MPPFAVPKSIYPPVCADVPRSRSRPQLSSPPAPTPCSSSLLPPHSLPIESVLMPDSMLPFSCGSWKCEEGIERVSFTIVLPHLARVRKKRVEEGGRRSE